MATHGVQIRLFSLVLISGAMFLPLDGRAEGPRPSRPLAALPSLLHRYGPGGAPCRVGLIDNQRATGSLHLRNRQQGDPWIGTGVLLDRFGSTGRLGLVITSSHNLPGRDRRCLLRFSDARGEAQRAPVLATLLDNPDKEYALLAVKLPPGMGDAPVARISGDPGARPSCEVYSVAYVEDHHAPGAPGAPGTPRAVVRSGGVRDGGALRLVDPGDGRPLVPSQKYSYRSGSGCSGAGVFRARTGELEALHWGNTTLFGRSIRSHAVPVELILWDIERKVGEIPYPRARAAVEQLLTRSGVAIPPKTASQDPHARTSTHTIKDLSTIRYP